MQHDLLQSWGATDRVLTLALESPDLTLARVISQERGQYRVITETGERTAVVSGAYMYATDDPTHFPAVGDWALIAGDESLAVIQRLIPRATLITRKAAGTGGDAQLIAANVDVVFICMALNEDFNLRRLERYLSVIWESGATPVVVLTKADLATDLLRQIASAEGAAAGAQCIVTASLQGDGVEQVRSLLKPGQTIAFLGSSGVGKSTLVNTLAGREVFRTAGLRNDGQGRHTTTSRQAILLPDTGILIDTPGMRELGLDTANIERTFTDIEDLAARCRFGDCTHEREPGCAVRAAIESGDLDEGRFRNYVKLTREADYAGRSSREIAAIQMERIFGSKGAYKASRREFKSRQKNRTN